MLPIPIWVPFALLFWGGLVLLFWKWDFRGRERDQEHDESDLWDDWKP